MHRSAILVSAGTSVSTPASAAASVLPSEPRTSSPSTCTSSSVVAPSWTSPQVAPRIAGFPLLRMVNLACTSQLSAGSTTDSRFGQAVRAPVQVGTRLVRARRQPHPRLQGRLGVRRDVRELDALVLDLERGPLSWSPAHRVVLDLGGAHGVVLDLRAADRVRADLRAAHSVGLDLRRADRVGLDLRRADAVARQRRGRRRAAQRHEERQGGDDLRVAEPGEDAPRAAAAVSPVDVLPAVAHGSSRFDGSPLLVPGRTPGPAGHSPPGAAS